MSLCRLLPPLAFVLLSLAPLAANGIGQFCPSGNDLSTPDADLIDNGDQTITHTKTGLMWKQCNEGLSGAGCTTGSTLYVDWAGALGAATIANLNTYAGHDDWRLPNWKELQSIIETGCYNWAINLSRFVNTQANTYWTSTTALADRALARRVSFVNGFSSSDPKSLTSYVRLVRGGPGFASYDRTNSPGCTLDVDGNNSVDALTDGLLLMRAMFGFTGTAVTAGAIGSGNPTRTNWAQIRAYLNGSCATNFGP